MGVGIVVVFLGIVLGWASVALGIKTGSRVASGALQRPHEVSWLWVVPAALSAQVLWASRLSAQPEASQLFRWIVPLSTTALLAMIVRNASWRGARLVACGVAMNLLVIVANGGLMPITIADAAASVPKVGATISEGQPLPGTKDVVLAPGAMRLGFLTDHLAVRLPYGPPREFSPGDFVMLLGVALWVGHGMRASLLERGSAWLDTSERIGSSSYRVTTF